MIGFAYFTHLNYLFKPEIKFKIIFYQTVFLIVFWKLMNYTDKIIILKVSKFGNTCSAGFIAGLLI